MDIRDEYLIKRRKKKISQSEIAKVTGVTQSMISRFETGDCSMSNEKIKRYRDYIDSNN
ncbi:helix-turn-helix domain-containing protein [Schinkia azotoformans]|uniref:helix-turn-helix domain-containing protein n=1 Tax=Schinkia azotoformans TaxID=1454 RepID=UPI002DC047CA|nr:helix-turn-helix transcriptional regulator [Schinkia azotoformans]MEC1720605.1 helix-turn-helix transcriptional regulator [Schinkia azotoformans]MED4411744.1 helix-turn-helix transcriptional regulator [Schinkia azotoformans]